MKKESGFSVVELLTVLFVASVSIAAVWGWVWNIVKIVAIAGDPIGGMLVVRCIGIFVAPLGAVLGFL